MPMTATSRAQSFPVKAKATYESLRLCDEWHLQNEESRRKRHEALTSTFDEDLKR